LFLKGNRHILPYSSSSRLVKGKTSFLRARKEVGKPFAAVWISHLLVELFLLMPSALVPVFRSEFGLSLFQAGLLITIPNLCRLVIVIPTGIFADKFGPRPLIILSMLVAGVSGLFLSQCANAFMLLILLCALAISVTLYHPPGMSVIGRLFSDPPERSTAMGLHGASGCIGQAIGTVSLGLLLAGFGWRFPYLVFSIPLLVWMIFLFKLKTPHFSRAENKDLAEHSPDKDVKVPLLTTGFAFLLVTMGLNALANSGVLAFTTTFFTVEGHLSVQTSSIIFGLAPLVGVIGALSAGIIASRFGDKNALTLIYAGQVIFLLGLITVPVIEFAALSFLIFQMFSAALWTPTTSMVAALTHNRSGGKAYSLFYFAGDALGAISPLIAALMIESSGILSPFIFGIILLACSSVIVRFIKKA
jgi:MFS family permease